MSAPAPAISSDPALSGNATEVYVPQREHYIEAAINPLILTRWSGSGRRRLYVNAPDGSHVGWADLDTGANSLVMREFGADFVRALSEASLEDVAASYVPRRAQADPARQEGAAPKVLVPRHPAPDQPVFEAPLPHSRPQPQTPLLAPRTDWPAPVGPPFVADLAANRPGQQLQAQIEAAHLQGQRPTAMQRIVLGKNAYSTWELGAIGERLVAQELARLVAHDRRWAFLNSVPVGTKDSDIDHLVVGPGGVFTVNAKYHRNARIWVGGDTVMVNGFRQPYVRNSRFEAQRAGKLLSAATGISVPVRGLVVPVRAGNFTVKQQPQDVNVVIRSRLVRYLVNQRAVLDAAAIERVFGFARLSSTWRH